MPVYTVVTANGKPAVLLNIYRQPNSNTVDVAKAVHTEIANLKKDLPPGVDVRPFYDQSELVIDSIASVRDAILLGSILASLIMVLFLRDWGTSLVAGLVIPATIGITFITMRILGESFNLMTLGGLAAAVGLVIDDAIVVVENIVMHRDSGQSRGRSDSQRACAKFVSRWWGRPLRRLWCFYRSSRSPASPACSSAPWRLRSAWRCSLLSRWPSPGRRR